MKIKEIEKKKVETVEAKDEELKVLAEEKDAEDKGVDEVEDELVELIISGDEEPFESNRENGMLVVDEPEDVSVQTLEETLASETKNSSFGEETFSGKDFYRAARHEDFYSNGGVSDIYSAGKSGSAYTVGGEEEGRDFYSRPGEPQELAGEMRGEKRSDLEIGGMHSEKRDRRAEYDKYKAKSY